MSKTEEICKQEKTVAIIDDFFGIEIKRIEYGIDDYVYLVFGSSISKPTYHKLKIHYLKDDASFSLCGKTYRLSQAMRVI